MKIITFILAIYMLIGSLIPKTDFSQLLHLKDMMEHYTLHQEEATVAGNAFGLIDFIYIHFINPDAHELDDHEKNHDEQLPFQIFNTLFDFFYFSNSQILLLGSQIEN